jgi:hypothetical protein
MLVKRIKRLIGRHTRAPDAAGVHLAIWESELRAIAAETSAWSVETGGDLFGRWQDFPTVFLATKAGPKAQRDTAHFRLDVDYLRALSETLASDWSLRYFGDWHSHHRLGLTEPSGGDRRRIRNLGARNAFAAMAEVIVTLKDARAEPTVGIHPWLYQLSGEDPEPAPLRVKVLRGLSPVRQALLANGMLPEQRLATWQDITCARIRIGDDGAPPALEPPPEVDPTTRDKVLSRLAEALQAASGTPIEKHATAFGCILVAKLAEPYYLAFALGADWPMPVLEVHRLNRDRGTNESLKIAAAPDAPDFPAILEIYRAAKSSRQGEGHVDH